MKVGYCRVSTNDQSLDLQKDALLKTGCEKLFEDYASGSKQDRPGLAQCLEFLREGDVMIVWKLDRLGRSLGHLIEVINLLESRRIGFASLQEGMDTSTSAGKMIFHIFGSIAEFERNLIRERTMAGLLAARARGRRGGRRHVLTPKQIDMGIALANARKLTVEEICEQLECSRATYYRHIAPLLKHEIINLSASTEKQATTP